MWSLPSAVMVDNSTNALSCSGPKLHTDQPYHIRTRQVRRMGRTGQIIFGRPERLADAPAIALSASKGLAETNPFVFLADSAILAPLRARFCFSEL